MKKSTALSIVIALLAVGAFAHAGAHTILGTVVKSEAGQIVIAKKDGVETTVLLSAETIVERDGKAVPREELVAGVRVSVHLAHDGKTAAKVKLAPKK